MKIVFLMLLAISNLVHQCQAQDSFFTTIESLCNHTLHSKLCFHSLSTLLDPKKNYDPFLIYKISIRVSINEVFRASEVFSKNGPLHPTILETKEKMLISALESCRDLLSLALHNLNTSLPTNDSITTAQTQTNFRVRLSAAGADLSMCLHEFEHAPVAIRNTIATNLEKSTQLVSISLSIISNIDEHMRLHEEPSVLGADINDWTADWVVQNEKQRIQPDAVVAGDGSGNYTTISEAISGAPEKSDKRYVIYVKEGIYHENVVIRMNKWNILMYGDGMETTIVSSNRSNATTSSTVQSATFSVQGEGFVAMDMGFRNTYGPGSQAVALFSASDKSVFYRCVIDGYQDTLFAHSHRQFYRECRIYGTLDFIFGDAAVVIQNTTILVKKGKSRVNAIFAQGKDLPHSVTGTSVQNCSILAGENLEGIDTYLGRPWKNYSTTIIMESRIESLVHPQGWLPWKSGNTSVPDTILYVEYSNVGPGSDTTNRVQWEGVKVGDTQDYARNFTVRSFLDGLSWIPSTGVPFKPDL